MSYAYVAETIPEDVMKDILDTYWPKISEVPKPKIIVKNDPDDPFVRWNERDGDILVISNDSPEQIKYRGNINYYDRAYPLTIEFRSMKSRQRVRDMWRIVKAICFARKWNFTGYQLIRLQSYQESTNSALNCWRGVQKIIVEAGGVAVEALV